MFFYLRSFSTRAPVQRYMDTFMPKSRPGSPGKSFSLYCGGRGFISPIKALPRSVKQDEFVGNQNQCEFRFQQVLFVWLHAIQFWYIIEHGCPVVSVLNDSNACKHTEKMNGIEYITHYILRGAEEQVGPDSPEVCRRAARQKQDSQCCWQVKLYQGTGCANTTTSQPLSFPATVDLLLSSAARRWYDAHFYPCRFTIHLWFWSGT